YKLNILKEIANFTLKDINESLFNHHDKFNDLASDQFNTIIVETLLYERRNQNINFSICTIDNTTLKNSFHSNYKIRTIINNLYQSHDFEVIKIIESSLSIYYNQFYKVPFPEILIIGLHYGGYSASYIEIEYSKYLYSIFQSLQAKSTFNSKYYKTPNENHVLKQDDSSAITNVDSYLIYEFQSERATKINDTITFSMNEISMLNDTITNIGAQLKDIRDSVEESINLLEEKINIDGIQQKIMHDINRECNKFEILYLTPICKEVKILLEEVEKFNIRLYGAYEIGVREVPYSQENKIKFPGRSPNLKMT
ncbi:24596_t:CDS:1, partial [Gigaspora margarita]